MNSASLQSAQIQASEKLVLTDANEDDVIGGILQDIEQLQAQAPKDPGLVGKVFQKITPKAIISVVKGSETTSGMQEIFQPSKELREALELASPAEPVNAERPTIDETRLSEALANSAKVLTGNEKPAEAQIVRGYSIVATAERMQTPLDRLRELSAHSRELVATRAHVAHRELV